MNITPLITVVSGTPQAPQVFKPGQNVTLNPEEATRLLDAQMAVVSVSKQTDSSELIESIVDAIAELPKSGFAKDGKPNVKALQNILEFEVSAIQRDEAWQQFQQLSQTSPAKSPSSS